MAAPDAKVILHTAAEPEHEVYTSFLDKYGSRLDYDIIGVSYFPYKKTYGLSALEENIEILSKKYNKDVCIVETAMPYTTEDYAGLEKLGENARKGMAAGKNSALDNSKYSISPGRTVRIYERAYRDDWQTSAVSGLLLLGTSMDTCCRFGMGDGSASVQYLGVKEPCGNEWANQALFDYEGNALPALHKIGTGV